MEMCIVNTPYLSTVIMVI